jgi:phosphatidate cytidylyltransferase
LLIQRLATAAIGIPVILGVVWVGGLLFAAVVAVAVFVAVLEIGAARGVMKAPLTLVAAGLAAAMPLAAYDSAERLLGALALAVMAQSAAFVLVTREPERDVSSWLWGVASIFYFGLLAAHFVLLREGVVAREFSDLNVVDYVTGVSSTAPSAFLIETVADGKAWLTFSLFTVWTIDTGAYAVGRAIGRHKLAPAISPGKTIEGGMGSAVAGIIAVFVLNAALGLNLPLEHRIALGLLLPPVVLIGDLAESAVKRSLGVKDSSGLVPGHGGVADRLDSLLFAVPVVYWYLKWIIL